MSNSRFDIYAYGMIASSTLHILQRDFPRAQGYAELSQSYANVGGEAANSAIVLSRLGLRVQLDGSWLSKDSEGRRTLALLREQRLHLDLLRFKKNHQAPREIVFAAGKSRTIFANYGAIAAQKRTWNTPNAGAIQKARVLCLDPFLADGSKKAAAVATRFKIPYVTMDCAWNDSLLPLASITIISEEYRQRTYPSQAARELMARYLKKAQGLMVFTSGEKSILFGRKETSLQVFRPQLIEAVDTTGAGDSFRAGMIYGLLQGWSDLQSIQFSSALAGMVCQRFPGVLKSPMLAKVIKCLP